MQPTQGGTHTEADETRQALTMPHLTGEGHEKRGHAKYKMVLETRDRGSLDKASIRPRQQPQAHEGTLDGVRRCLTLFHIRDG